MAFLVLMTSVMVLWGVCDANFTMTLMHTNDIHSNFEQFTNLGSRCSEKGDMQGNCYGGVARLKTAVDTVRREHNNTLLLDGGDQYQGTLYFFRYGGNITSSFMNWLRYDAMALGNHEFDQGVAGLEPFLRDADFDVLSSNLNASQDPCVHALVRPSTVKVVGGVKVGIVGYTTEDTQHISNPGRLRFKDVVESVREEARRLREEEGVKVILALGHAGFTVDLKVAEIPQVNVVIGGHTNTFLYTGDPPSNEKCSGPYPTLVTRGDGTQSAVVQCFTRAKYLCVLHLIFSDGGHLLSAQGNPQLLNASVWQDSTTLDKLQPWREGVDSLGIEVVGQTTVRLEGNERVCRTQECNMGNLFADALVSQARLNANQTNWAAVNISLVNGGSIRSSIDAGNVTVADVISVLPFGNTMSVMKIKGKHLKELFEHSVARQEPCKTQDLFGGFLQVSGVRVRYDLNKPSSHRVVSLETRADERPDGYRKVEAEKEYHVIISSYLLHGGDSYMMLPDLAQSIHPTGQVDSDVLTEYLKAHIPVSLQVEGRISFQDNSDVCNTSLSTQSTT